jgi:hypothetical protein
VKLFPGKIKEIIGSSNTRNITQSRGQELSVLAKHSSERVKVILKLACKRISRDLNSFLLNIYT